MQKAMMTLLSALLLCTVTVASASQMKIGVVNFQEVQQKVRLTEMFKQRISGLRTEFKGEIDILQAQREAIVAERSKLNDKEAKFTDAERKQLEAKIKKQETEMSKVRQEMRTQMVDARKKIAEESQVFFEKTIGKVAKKAGVDVVLNTNSVVYAADKVDLTDKVIAAFQKDHKIPK